MNKSPDLARLAKTPIAFLTSSIFAPEFERSIALSCEKPPFSTHSRLNSVASANDCLIGFTHGTSPNIFLYASYPTDNKNLFLVTHPSDTRPFSSFTRYSTGGMPPRRVENAVSVNFATQTWWPFASNSFVAATALAPSTSSHSSFSFLYSSVYLFSSLLASTSTQHSVIDPLDQSADPAVNTSTPSNGGRRLTAIPHIAVRRPSGIA